MSDVELITVGRIVKPFGVRGQVRVQSLTDVPGRLEQLQNVVLVLPTGREISTTVTNVQVDGRSHLLQFAAFSTPEEAKAYRGAWLRIPKGPVPPAPEGHWYQFELIGLTVKDQTGGILGVVENVLDLPSGHMFVVRGEEKEIMIPASRRWVTRIDIEGQVITVAHQSEWSDENEV